MADFLGSFFVADVKGNCWRRYLMMMMAIGTAGGRRGAV